jgi:hypothetical protein
MMQFQQEQTDLKWEEGVIGKIETFLLSRFPISEMWARALATTINSTALYGYVLQDQMGSVKGNIWSIYVSGSGTGVKTPPIMFGRRLVNAYDKNKLSVTKFTPEGYTEYVQGTSEKIDKEGKVQRKFVPSHPINVILRDEASVILGENKSSPAFASQKEYLSKLWDGYIEGYYTRKCQFEGNIDVYVSLCAASSKYFYKLLDEEFFVQGTGNRILWVTQKDVKIDRLESSSFFGVRGENDHEFKTLAKDVVKNLKYVENLGGKSIEDCCEVEMESKAGELWCDFHYEYSSKANKVSCNAGSYLIKIPLNALKLSMNYASSRLGYLGGKILFIQEQDMKMAIEDVRKYEVMWKEALKEWRDYNQLDKTDKRLPTSKYDLRKFVEFALLHDGLITVNEIQSIGDYPDKTKVGEILELGYEKGWLAIIANCNNASKLTPEQLKRFKKPKGFLANIYQVTEKGKAEYEES